MRWVGLFSASTIRVGIYGSEKGPHTNIYIPPPDYTRKSHGISPVSGGGVGGPWRGWNLISFLMTPPDDTHPAPG